MIVDVGFAELHNALFLGGKNFGLKMDPHRHGGLSLQYDTVEKELLVGWNKYKAHVPSANVAYYIPGAPQDRKIVQMGHPEVLGTSGTAQVETPMSHVHAGVGHGKTGRTK